MNYFVPGDWDAFCPRCRFRKKASEFVREWDGTRVCLTCFEPRHPQELRRQPVDKESVPWSQPVHSTADLDPGFTFTVQSVPTDTGALELFQVRGDSGLEALELDDSTYLFVR